MTDANDSIRPDVDEAQPAEVEEAPVVDVELEVADGEAPPSAEGDAEAVEEPVASLHTRRKTRVGVVISDTQNKTVVVRVDRLTAHRKYRKVIRRSKRYYAHDENNEAHVGDRVQISETRPRSKLKRWRLQEVLQRGTSA